MCFCICVAETPLVLHFVVVVGFFPVCVCEQLDVTPELMCVLGELTCAFRCIVFSISRIKELAQTFTHIWYTHTHMQEQGTCMQKHPPTDTQGERRGKSRCVCRMLKSHMIDCVCVCVMCQCLLPHYYDLHMPFLTLIIDLPLAERRNTLIRFPVGRCLNSRFIISVGTDGANVR